MDKLGKKSTIIIAVIAVLLVGVVVLGTRNTNDITNCILENEDVKIEYVYESKKGTDELVKVVSRSETNYVNQGYSKEEATKTVEEYSKKIDGDGVNYKYKVKEDIMIETLTIDLEKADHVYMSELGYISRPADDVDTVSLEETIKNVKTLEAKCKVKK